MIFQNKNLLLVYFLAVMLALTPFISLGVGETRKEFAASGEQFLNPDRWFELLKENITIPLPGSGTGKDKGEEIKVPTPEEALKEVSPQLQEINRGVREETGVDLAKFLGWFAKVLKVFFQVVINALEQVSKALGS